ncbi:NYN domain-containing protein [Pseudobacteriovorax antillogorgiicola]|uniref:Uncharacterized conserved protein, LabA/DUF88 family n=1 Tax=Pseudobacteriovorax antillogorgiicola TaxID=1513793 RepID=A0A1Y6BPI1_9BACT|nr:NYN domain-containing protein [Pseudobacteriovorax antillogorgiicola]TCS55501.1 uncharacterized LabA/DUF88 family protein [Pseudobacteriovorax antillogorgiicola]SMF11593.1 Uncharacterized conserved protein, LabA/DUF88 family [Pseudobacteriovorax antillogorgiicola]
MRAAIFIDGGYIQSQFKHNHIDPDWEEISDFLLEPLRQQVPLDLLRCYYYYCAPWMSQEPTESELKRMENHKEFVSDIENLDRWAMRLGKLEKRWDGKKEYFEQKRVDVLLSVDLVRHAAAGHIQHAVLVAGDSDFVPAVEAAKEHGVTVSLWCGNFRTVHKDLIALADEVHTFRWDEFPRFVYVDPKPAKPKGGNSSNNKGATTSKGPKKDDQGPKKGTQQNRSRNNNRNSNQQGRGRPRRHEKKDAKKELQSAGDKSSWTERIRKWWEED